MFPFTSETKKMGILVKSLDTDKYIYLVKGAEVVIEPKINHASRITCSEACEEFATEGLRTLAFAQKVMTAEEVQIFQEGLTKAKLMMNKSNVHIAKLVNQIERDMDFLGVTGVEDRL